MNYTFTEACLCLARSNGNFSEKSFFSENRCLSFSAIELKVNRKKDDLLCVLSLSNLFRLRSIFEDQGTVE